MDAVDDQREVSIEDIDGPMVEEDWRVFASASAAAGVRSTLSFPLVVGGHVIGGANLYAATEDAFTGHHEELAEVFGSWAGHGVSNADMSFSSRDRAREGPTRVAEQSEIDIAVGVLMGQQRIGPDEARAVLRAAALRAGVDQLQIARAVVAGLSRGRAD